MITIISYIYLLWVLIRILKRCVILCMNKWIFCAFLHTQNSHLSYGPPSSLTTIHLHHAPPTILLVQNRNSSDMDCSETETSDFLEKKLFRCFRKSNFSDCSETAPCGLLRNRNISDFSEREHFLVFWKHKHFLFSLVVGNPDMTIHLGDTEVPQSLLDAWLEETGGELFSPARYHLLQHNCNTFANELAVFLTGRPSPDYVRELPDRYAPLQPSRRYSDLLLLLLFLHS